MDKEEERTAQREEGKNANLTADNKEREKAITRTSVIGICANIFLSAFKAGAGLVAGSISVVLDAINNLTDAFSSVITILGIKLAKKKPDENHPYGYGRIEYFSTMVIALIVFSSSPTPTRIRTPSSARPSRRSSRSPRSRNSTRMQAPPPSSAPTATPFAP